MLNKYKEEYNKVVLALIEMHNAHVDILDGPNRRKVRDLKRALRNLGPVVREFKKILDLISMEVARREVGSKGKTAIDPESIPQEVHDWVSKGLNRKRKFDPKTSRKNRNE